MKRLQVYPAPGITVTFDPNVCIHSGVCVRSLPAVFDVRRARWIEADAASAVEVAETISRCPSGALQYYRNVDRDPAAAYALSRAVTLNRIGLALSNDESREARAGGVAEAIRAARNYAWAGLYDVGADEIAAIAWTGNHPPAHPRFPRTHGLTGSAVAEKKTVVANDVAADPRYLETLGSTRAEIIVPVVDGAGGEVVGTIDVASDRAGAFDDRDIDLLEACAKAAAALWNS
jgi:putative methionine-R-sulfoxide reductase with GAF domain/uncharacterized Fe-S cluster protein YjdI